MGLLGDLAKLARPDAPMPCDCEGPARGVGIVPGLDDHLVIGADPAVEDLRFAPPHPPADARHPVP